MTLEQIQKLDNELKQITALKEDKMQELAEAQQQFANEHAVLKEGEVLKASYWGKNDFQPVIVKSAFFYNEERPYCYHFFNDPGAELISPHVGYRMQPLAKNGTPHKGKRSFPIYYTGQFRREA